MNECLIEETLDSQPGRPTAEISDIDFRAGGQDAGYVGPLTFRYFTPCGIPLEFRENNVFRRRNRQSEALIRKLEDDFRGAFELGGVKRLNGWKISNFWPEVWWMRLKARPART